MTATVSFWLALIGLGLTLFSAVVGTVPLWVPVLFCFIIFLAGGR